MNKRKRDKGNFWAIAALTIIALGASPAVLAQTVVPITVLPLGNSITHGGVGGFPSYRRDLWFLLANAGYAMDFIGSHTTYPYDPIPVPPAQLDFDLDHEGHSGWKVDELEANIEGWLQGYDAAAGADIDVDIALIHAGTNDLINEGNNQTTIDSTLIEMGGLIAKLRADNPNIIILLAKIIPGTNLNTAPFNTALENWVPSQNNTENPDIIVIDHANGYVPATDNFDSLHPNNLGEAKMATAWFNGITSFLTAGNQCGPESECALFVLHREAYGITRVRVLPVNVVVGVFEIG